MTLEETLKSLFVIAYDSVTKKIKRVAIPADLQIGLQGKPFELQLLGRLSIKSKDFSVTNVNKGIIHATNDDSVACISLIDTPLSGRITFYLPSNPRDGQLYFVKDNTGTASTVPIDIKTPSGVLIDGQTTKTVVDNYGSLALFWFHNHWHMLCLGVGFSSNLPQVEVPVSSLTSSFLLTQTDTSASLPNAKILTAGDGITINTVGSNTTVSSYVTNLTSSYLLTELDNNAALPYANVLKAGNAIDLTKITSRDIEISERIWKELSVNDLDWAVTTSSVAIGDSLPHSACLYVKNSNTGATIYDYGLIDRTPINTLPPGMYGFDTMRITDDGTSGLSTKNITNYGNSNLYGDGTLATNGYQKILEFTANVENNARLQFDIIGESNNENPYDFLIDGVHNLNIVTNAGSSYLTIPPSHASQHLTSSYLSSGTHTFTWTVNHNLVYGPSYLWISSLLLSGAVYSTQYNLNSVIVENGKCGFGTTTPETDFHVSGSSILQGTVTFVSGVVEAKNFIKSQLGFSGSLTKLCDGTSYIKAGAGVTVATASNGQITISSEIASVPTVWFDGGNQIKSTGSVSIDSGNRYASSLGTDVFFFVSGSKTPASANDRKISLFGGDVLTSGSITSQMGLSGSLTTLSDGTSYLVAGNNVTINSSSNGQVIITASISGTGSGDSAATYLTLSTSPVLTNTRTLNVSGSSGLKLVDNGALNTATLSVNDNYVATITGSNFSGPVVASGGLSGSLQKLPDGTTEYIKGGAGITVTTSSQGQIVISTNTGAGVSAAGVFRGTILTGSTSHSGTGKVPFDTAITDTAGWWNSTNKCVTPDHAGWYFVNARVRRSSNDSAILILYKSGSGANCMSPDIISYVYAPQGSTLVYVNGSTDYLEIYSYFGNGLNYTTGIYDTFWEIIGPLF